MLQGVYAVPVCACPQPGYQEQMQAPAGHEHVQVLVVVSTAPQLAWCVTGSQPLCLLHQAGPGLEPQRLVLLPGQQLGLEGLLGQGGGGGGHDQSLQYND